MTYDILEEFIRLKCNASGQPNSYTYIDWEHQSGYREHIRYIKGSAGGTLLVNKTENYSENYQNNGYYICKLSNGISDRNGDKFQKGMEHIVMKEN